MLFNNILSESKNITRSYLINAHEYNLLNANSNLDLYVRLRACDIVSLNGFCKFGTVTNLAPAFNN